MRVGSLELSGDLSPADWIADRIHEFGVDVGSIIPEGFQAYTRLWHAHLPLALWLIGALIAAWAFIDFGPLADVLSQDFAELVFDLWVLPMTFIRGLDSASLEDLWASGLGPKLTITGVRLLGFVCLAYFAVAVRAYTRIF